MGGLANEITARCRKEGELLFERHRRLAAEARLTEIQTKLIGPTHLAKQLVFESQKKNPNIKRIASSLEDGLSNLSKGKSPPEDEKSAATNGLSAEIDARDARISTLQAQLAQHRNNLKVHAKGNGSSAESAAQDASIAASQAQCDEQQYHAMNGTGATLAEKDATIAALQAQLGEQHHNVNNDASAELEAKDAKIAALQAQLDEQQPKIRGSGASAALAEKDAKIAALQAQLDEQQPKYEEIMRDMTRQVNEALAQQQVEYDNLARINEQLVREHAQIFEDRAQREATVAEELSRMRAELVDKQAQLDQVDMARMDILADRERVCRELAEMVRLKQMHDWYDAVSECQVSNVDQVSNCIDDASEDQDPEAHKKVVKTHIKVGMDSWIWKQRELLIRLVRKSAHQREEYLTVQDELKRKTISIQKLQQKVEEMSHEMQVMRSMTEESYRLHGAAQPPNHGFPSTSS